MKAYGYSRRNKLECKYGCCGHKGLKGLRNQDVVDRAARKTGRRAGKLEALYSQ